MIVTITITSTIPVAVAPIPLITMLRLQPASRERHQWRTIPSCESENAVNTLTTFSWIRRVRFASNATIRALAATARITTPFENTNRSPRLRNCEGMNRSRARIAGSRGKSW